MSSGYRRTRSRAACVMHSRSSASSSTSTRTSPRRCPEDPMPAPDDDDEERYRTLRSAIADYARETEVEPPSRGVDELMAAARARVATRTPVEEPRPGVWARLQAWLAAHQAVASAAVMVLFAIAGFAYVRQRGVEVTHEAAPMQREQGYTAGSAT